MKNHCQSLMLPHENPDLVAKRGKNFSQNTPSHSAIRWSTCRAAQQLLTLRTAELLRRHGPGKAMTGGGGATLLDQLPTLGQRGGLHPQPSQHAPDRAVMQGPLFHGGRLRRRLIAGHAISRAGRLTVGLPVVLQVAAGKVQKGRAGVALIGEYESWGNR